jgi:hypothetical protein
MPVGVERLEVTRSNHADSTLSHAEVAEAGLPKQRPAGAEVVPLQHRARIGDHPQVLRGDRVALPVGRAAGQPDVTDAERSPGHTAQPLQDGRVCPRRLGQPAADRAHEPGRRGGLEVDGPVQ